MPTSNQSILADYIRAESESVESEAQTLIDESGDALLQFVRDALSGLTENNAY